MGVSVVVASFCDRNNESWSRCGVISPRAIAPTLSPSYRMPPKKKLKGMSPSMSLCGLSEDLLDNICSHLDPPDVFNLATSSKKLFRPFGPRLLQSSLRRQLDEVLHRITTADGAPFTVQDLFPDEERQLDFDSSGRPQVILSGSAVVQCALGPDFRGIEDEGEDDDDSDSEAVDDDECEDDEHDDDSESEVNHWKDADIDIFCTWDAAPMIRRRLFQRCGLVCSGVDNSYNQQGRDLAGDIDNCMEESTKSIVHHVESYSSRPTEGTTEYINHDLDIEEDLDYASDQYAKKLKEWGEAALKMHNQLGNEGSPSPCFMWNGVGIPGGALNTDFLYDYELRSSKFVQLIVAKPEVKDARMLLKNFDLEICKCSFNGKGFTIPAPADTFAGRTIITPARRDIIEQFVKGYYKAPYQCKAPDQSYHFDQASEKLLKGITKKAWKGVGLGPPSRKTHYERYIFCQKLFERLKKYRARGLEITNAPPKALDLAEEFPSVPPEW